MALPKPVPLADLCRSFGGIVDPQAAAKIVDRVTTPEDAGAGCLTPILSRRALRSLSSPDAVLLVDAEIGSDERDGQRWLHPHPRWALAGILAEAEPVARAQRSPSAQVDPGALLGQDVEVGPNAIIMDSAVVGDHCTIGPHAVIYGSVRLGRRVVVGAGAVVGRPGFGWAFGPDGQVRRMPHLGGVIVEDDVEIGALATVDAGTLRATRLGPGCKLDAHVHVGHNVEIGGGTMVAAQVGFAGSARIGQGVLIGGQAGFADHVSVGDHARVAGKAGVIADVRPAASVAGYPAVERLRWLRSVAKGMRG